MESDLQRHHHNFHDHQHQHQHHQNQTNSSLTRYRSAPSSYFSSIIDREFCEQIFNQPSSPESERIFSRFMTTGGGSEGTADDASQVRVKETNSQPTQFVPSMNNEAAGFPYQQSNYGSASQNFYRSPSRPPLPNQGLNLSAEGSYTIGTGRILPQMKTGGGGNNSSLVRHSSLPAGPFSRIDIENNDAAMRGIGNFGASKSTNEEGSFSSGSRLKNYSSGPPTSAGIMSPIAEIDDKNLATNPDSGGFGEGRGDNYVTGFPIGSWDDSPVIADDISGLKTLGDDDGKTFASMYMSETQNMDSGNRPPSGLAHHLSLPKTAAEMAAIEKFLQLQDSVPCKIRAKRGCATHPRSIAERVRRTRISERMRKLQDLVPNMDKQTNTADMLDLAVEYIKDLQQQAQTLSDTRARCTCSNKHQP